MAKLACFLGVRRTSETHKSDLVSFASWAVFSCSLPASCLQTVWHAALVLPSNFLRVELPICMRRAWIITSLHQDRLLAVILSLGMIWTTANFYMIKPYPCFQVINHANHPSNHIYDICNYKLVIAWFALRKMITRWSLPKEISGFYTGTTQLILN